MESLLGLILYLIVWGLVIYVLFWGIGKIGLPEPFAKIATVLVVVLAVVILLNALFGFMPLPVTWRRF